MYFGTVGTDLISDYFAKHILNIFEQVWTQFKLLSAVYMFYWKWLFTAQSD